MAVVPTIRLGDTDLSGLAETLRTTCIDVGFFYLEGHGISAELLAKTLHQSRLLFELPTDMKELMSDKVMTRGYTAMGEETLDPKNQKKGDSKEGFYIGREVPIDSPGYNPSKFAGPNQWPSTDETQSMKDPLAFRETMTTYFDECSRVAFRVTQLLALALGLDEHHFDENFSAPLAALRLLHYAREKSNPDEGHFACGAHSDYGMLTLLLTDNCAGLQLYTKEGKWIDVPPKPGAFVVNLGDMLERWTNGLFRSTLHRVLTAGDAERYSIPFFYEPDYDTNVAVLEACCSKDNPPKYPPTTSGEHLKEKYRQTHADFNPKEEE